MSVGWGRSTWGAGPWGQPASVSVSVSVSGVASTSALGTVTLDAEANVIPTGQVATSALGSLSVVAKANVTPSSQVGTSALGTLSVVAKANVIPTGQSATSAIGGVGVNGEAVANATGVTASLGAVSVDVDGEANVSVTGQSATSAVGSVIIHHNEQFSITGVAASENVGSVTSQAGAKVTPDSLLIIGILGTPQVYGLIDDSQTPNYSGIDSSQTANYSTITDTQTPDWEEVAQIMATYVNDLRLKEIATGDEAGTWGTSTNTNLELIGEAFSFGTEAITTNADTHTTTIADGSTDPGRSIYLKYTGTLDSACTITIGPNTVSKLWFIENGTSGSQNIIISQGSGANITIPAGDTKVVYSDGAGSGAAIVDAFASLNVVDLKVEDDLTVTDDVSIGGDATVTGAIASTGNITENSSRVATNGRAIAFGLIFG